MKASRRAILFTLCMSFSLAGNAALLFGTGLAADNGTQAGFGTELEAVVAATYHDNPLPIREDREYMDAILAKGGIYFYPVPQGQIQRDNVTLRFRVPQGYQVIAFWHTHRANHNGREYFSDVDTKRVRMTSKRFYLSDPLGFLKVFSPGDQVLSAAVAKIKPGIYAHRGYGMGELLHDENGDVIHVATMLSVF